MANNIFHTHIFFPSDARCTKKKKLQVFCIFLILFYSSNLCWEKTRSHLEKNEEMCVGESVMIKLADVVVAKVVSSSISASSSAVFCPWWFWRGLWRGKRNAGKSETTNNDNIRCIWWLSVCDGGGRGALIDVAAEDMGLEISSLSLFTGDLGSWADTTGFRLSTSAIISKSSYQSAAKIYCRLHREFSYKAICCIK